MIKFFYFLKSSVIHFINKSILKNVPKIKGGISILIDRITYYVYLFKNYLYMTKRSGISSNTRNEQVIVSLTSFPKRINTVWITISTLLNQSFKPNRIILWLSEEEFPGRENSLPKRLVELKKRGLEIKFCENLKPHKKYYYTMVENPNAIVITFDDDILYPENIVKVLMDYHENHMESIICNRGHIMTFQNEGFAPYNEWLINPKLEETPRLDICPTGIGGVLYPTNSCHIDLFNKEDIYKLCLNADDLWLKAMSAMKGTTVLKANIFNESFAQIPKTDQVGLTKTNVNLNQNDVQLKNILSKYNFADYVKKNV